MPSRPAMPANLAPLLTRYSRKNHENACGMQRPVDGFEDARTSPRIAKWSTCWPNMAQRILSAYVSFLCMRVTEEYFDVSRRPICKGVQGIPSAHRDLMSLCRFCRSSDQIERAGISSSRDHLSADECLFLRPLVKTCFDDKVRSIRGCRHALRYPIASTCTATC
jgi:hypothetical protein